MTPIPIPQLTTDRLLLREFRPEDFEPYAAMMADPVVGRFLMDGRPLSRAEAWRQMAMFIGHWALRGYGVWAVEERATGNFIGRIGCLELEGFPAFEIAYTLAPSAWGHGYAREGAAAALRYAREVLGRKRIASFIRPDNIASIRVAQSLGAIASETVEFFGAPSVVYWYPEPEPRAIQAAPPLIIRDVRAGDFAAWQELWNGYNAFYGRSGATALPMETTRLTWERLLDPDEPMHALVAESRNGLVGLAHIVFHRSTTLPTLTCYLQDLFTVQELRAQGIGRRLIEAVYDRARAQEAGRVYWQTHQTNATAMRLYDQVAEKSGFVVYRKTL